MRRRIMPERLVLLDADVVIEAFRQGIWDALIARTHVHVARAIIEEANFYPDPLTGQDRRIDLQSYIDQGKITVLDPDEEALAQVSNTCRRCLELHDGERSSLATLVRLGSEYRFCTGDKAAIQALVLLELSGQSISLDRLLGDAGIARPGPLGNQFTEQYLERWLRQGSVLRVEIGR